MRGHGLSFVCFNSTVKKAMLSYTPYFLCMPAGAIVVTVARSEAGDLFDADMFRHRIVVVGLIFAG